MSEMKFYAQILLGSWQQLHVLALRWCQ